MKDSISINISKNKNQYIAKDGGKSVLARGGTLHEVMENLEFAVEQLMPDPDEGLELTAKAKKRLALAKKNFNKKSTGLTLEEVIKKYGLEDQV